MIPYADALAIVLEHAKPLGVESLPLKQLFGHVLSEPVRAPHDLPLFDNSAVDGFGVRLSDLASASEANPAILRLQETIQAGDYSATALQPGSTVKILTGAPVPPGVEAVVMQEFTDRKDASVAVHCSAEAGENIRRRGEEYRQGDAVLPGNTLVTPSVAGLLASLGLPSATVYRKPRIAVVITGNELVPPGQPLAPGQIYESNSHSLLAALQALHCEVVTVRHVQDSLASTCKVLAEALEQADILISTGGVSVGEFDWVKDAAERLGVETRFWKVAIKPGKPIYFGTKGEKLVFGLPGNPVAVLLTLMLFVRPALQAMQGLTVASKPHLKARLLKDLRKKPARLDFVRAQLGRDDQGLTVLPTTGQGSHMLGGLAQADCLIPFDRDAAHWEAGAWVDVIPLEWRLAP